MKKQTNPKQQKQREKSVLKGPALPADGFAKLAQLAWCICSGFCTNAPLMQNNPTAFVPDVRTRTKMPSRCCFPQLFLFAFLTFLSPPLLFFCLCQQRSVPPVMAFHLGSLGFLTPFNFENFQSQVTQVIEGRFLRGPSISTGCS